MTSAGSALACGRGGERQPESGNERSKTTLPKARARAADRSAIKIRCFPVCSVLSVVKGGYSDAKGAHFGNAQR